MATRRMTRARSASEELGEPVYSRPAQIKKQSTLARISESPAQRLSMLKSFTPIQSSAIHAPNTENDAKLVDGLQDVWDLSGQYLQKILPETVTIEAIEELRNRFETSPRHWKAIEAQFKKLAEVLDIYPGKEAIDVAATNLQLFNLAKSSELIDGQHRPDDVLYRGNLAFAMSILVQRYVEGMDDFDSDEMLRILTQSLFSRATRNDQPGIAGDTRKFKATWELALELRTQEYIAAFADSVADEDEDEFDASGNLYKAFGEVTAIRGWDAPGLSAAELIAPQIKAIKKRITEIASEIGSLDADEVVVHALQDKFPIENLVKMMFQWAKERNSELVERIDQLDDGIIGIQEAIDTEQKKAPAKSAIPMKDSIIELGRGTPKEPKPSSSITRMATTASKGQPNQAAISQEVEDQFEPALFVGDEGGAIPFAEEDEEENHDDDLYDDAEEGPTSSKQPWLPPMSTMLAAASEGNKENRPSSAQSKKRSILDAQSQAKPITWSQYDEDEPEASAQRSQGKKRRIEVDHEEDGEQDDDEFDVSQDAGFQTQRTPSKGPSKRRLENQATPQQSSSRVDPARGSNSRPKLPPAQPLPNRATQGSVSRSTQLALSANQEAKARMQEGRTQIASKAQTRVPWSESEVDALIDYMEEYGCSWSMIKKQDSANKNVLYYRDQVGLKDKARNIAMDYLKSGQELPPAFGAVSLKKADIQRLKNLGIDLPSRFHNV